MSQTRLVVSRAHGTVFHSCASVPNVNSSNPPTTPSVFAVASFFRKCDRLVLNLNHKRPSTNQPTTSSELSHGIAERSFV